MATLNIFVSFEYGRDNNLKNQFYKQSEKESDHEIKNFSLNEAYQENIWKGKARNAIRRCHGVIVLVGRNTHNAPGVIVETDMARSLGKPTVQIVSDSAWHNNYEGIPHVEDRMRWYWKRIDRWLSGIAPRQ